MKNHLKTGFFSLTLIALTLQSHAAEAPASYATPQDAFEAFADALGKRDAVLEVFGTDAMDVLLSGDDEEDAENRGQIEALIQEGYRFQRNEDGRVTLLLGAEAWPFPIPLAKTDSAWAFDIEAGRDEVFYRRIGLNELETIDMIEAYVDIQSAYRLVDHDGDGVMEFAASILSSEGARDGLVWEGDDSPLGERIALASLDGFSDGETDQAGEPFGGYYYRILQRQGEGAPGGALDYIIGGNMIAGHALLAVPSSYGETGINSFIVSENGIIHSADLGENGLDAALEILSYNPDTTWSPIE